MTFNCYSYKHFYVINNSTRKGDYRLPLAISSYFLPFSLEKTLSIIHAMIQINESNITEVLCLFIKRFHILHMMICIMAVCNSRAIIDFNPVRKILSDRYILSKIRDRLNGHVYPAKALPCPYMDDERPCN